MKSFSLVPAIVLVCVSLSAKAQQTTLFGSNKTYSNQKIDVYTCADYISGTNILTGSTTADDNGNFSIDIDIKHACKITLDLGRARGTLYADTAMKYNIVLPDFEPKTKGDMLNPFFEPEEFLVGIKNPDRYNVNMYIDMFDYAYEDCLEHNYYKFMKNPDKHTVDSIINNLEHAFDSIPGDFFRTYRSYKYAWIKYMSYQRDWRYMSREYLDCKSVEYANPAYMDLFCQMFSNFFEFYTNTREGERLYSDVILAKSPAMAKQTLTNSMALSNDTLQEMVLLKGINDALYDNRFNSNSLYIMLDSMEMTTSVEQHKLIAQYIRNKSKLARTGTKAPDINLADTSGVLQSIEHNHGHFVYLNFISTDSYACLQDLDQLKILNEKTKEVMDIITISIDQPFDKTKKLFKRNGYNWQLLDYNSDPSVIERYKVRAYPSYFLIDTDGTLLMSPALRPSEGFEKRFRQIFNERKYGHSKAPSEQ